MKMYNIIGLFFIIYAVWVPQTQQALTETDLGTEKISIFQRSGESNKEYYTRLLSKNYDESRDKFDVRVQCLKILLPHLPIWDNDNYLQFVTVRNEVKNLPRHKSKYLTNIDRNWLESYRSYYTRIFEKHSDETLDEYIERLRIMKTMLPSLSCWADNSYLDYVRPHLEAYKLEAGKVDSSSSSIDNFGKDDQNDKWKVDSKEKRKSTGQSNENSKEEETVEVEIIGSEEEETEESTANDSQKNKKEDGKSPYEEKHYQGLHEANVVSTENIQTEKFIIYKKDGESDEQYYKRLLLRNYYEDIVKHEVRVECLKVMLPYLTIWRNDKYLNYVTVDNDYYNRPTYVSDHLDDISKHWDETDDEYYRRIFRKYDDERLDQYMERVGIMKSMYRTLSVWVNNNYIDYMRPYLEPYKREAERVNTIEVNGSDTSTSTSVSSTSSSLSASASISFGSDRSPVNTDEKHPEDKEEEESEEESKEDSKEESQEEEEAVKKSSAKKKKEKGESAKEKEDYHRREGESDVDYCKRIYGSNGKENKKKLKKEMKKLKKFLTKSEIKELKKICKKNKKY